MIDAVQCGHFRSGCYQSFQRILGDTPEGLGGFLPDAVSMAKSLGGGFPIGGFWVREESHGVKLCDVLGPGTHATTYGGTPLGCAVALAIFDVIEAEGLESHVRELGDSMRTELERIASHYPRVVRSVRGMGFMMGMELQPREQIPAFQRIEKPASSQFVNRLQEAGVLVIPSGQQVIRLLPPLNLTQAQADEGILAIERVVRDIADGPG